MSFIPQIKMTAQLLTQPFPITDFSGGITDLFIQGPANSYLEADNLLITIDRKLEQRQGSQLLDSTNYVLPSGSSRVGRLLNFNNDSYILAQSSQYLYALTPGPNQAGVQWLPLTGPTGNPALSGTSASDIVTSGEWQSHMYLTGDSATGSVCKIYNDSTGTFQTRTAGLPALVSTPNYAISALLAKCILVANDLRTQFLAHMNNYNFGFTDHLHGALDTVNYNLVNGTSVASSLTTLITLTTALQTALASHIGSALPGGNTAIVIGNTSSPVHYNTDASLNQALSTTAAPVDAPSCAFILDDLVEKYYFHKWAPYLHDIANFGSNLIQYEPTQGIIGYSATGIVVTPNLANALSVANNMYTVFNLHVVNDVTSLGSNHHDSFLGGETGSLSLLSLTCPLPVDFRTLITFVAHFGAQYSAHVADANAPFVSATITTTSGSASVTGVAINAGATSFHAQQGALIVDNTGTGVFSTNGYAYISVSALGTLTIGNFGGQGGAATAASSLTNTPVLISLTQAALYHWNQGSSGASATISQTTAKITPTPDLLSAITVLGTYYNACQLHMAESQAHSRLTGGNAIVQFFAVPIPQVGTYNYAFHWAYTYTVGVVTYTVVGPPTLIGPVESCVSAPAGALYQGTSTASLGPSPVQITGLPQLYNSASTNYDVANVQLWAFRTINIGTTYFTLAHLPNGTTTYSDTANDTLPGNATGIPLVDETTIYTTGGVVNFDPAPSCRYLHILNNTAYYGGVWDTGQFLPRRLRQSIQNAPDSSPGSFFDDLDDDIQGISSVRSQLVVFGKNSTYLVTGGFNPQGQGAMVHQKISDTIGCIAPASIVRTEIGIFFAGNDGFYYTDGYQVLKLTSSLNASYQKLTQTVAQRRRICGTYDKWTRRIWWSVQGDSADWDVSESWILDLNYGVSAQASFTTASSGDYWRPSSMLFFTGTMYRADVRGFIFVHVPGLTTDPAIITGTTPTSWATVGIPYNYTSCAVDCGTTFNRKWIPRISFSAKNVGALAAQITSINQNGQTTKQLAPILYGQTNYWGNPTCVWGSSAPVWNPLQQIDVFRRFSAGEMRADFKQIQITPATLGVYRYEDFPVGAYATVTGGATGSVAITVPGGYTGLTWPADCNGYVIAFQKDGYTAQYPITAGQGTATLTIGEAVSGTLVPSLSAQSWVIRGAMKNQKLSITAINFHYALLGKEQDAYHGPASSGENT